MFPNLTLEIRSKSFDSNSVVKHSKNEINCLSAKSILNGSFSNVTFEKVARNQRKWNTDGNLQRLVLVEYRLQCVW